MAGVPGKGGPVPKRSSQRRRRNKDSKPAKAKASGAVAVPPANSKWHAGAKRWYKSLKDSGQSQFFEPSDWEAAYFLAGEISEYLNSDRRSAMMFSHIWSAMGELLTTEASRRRLKLEIERDSGQVGEDGDVTDLDEYRKRAAAG
jgi:hypothetical protein